LPLGSLYPYFTFFQEIVVLMILFAVGWAFHRRYVEKLARLKRGWKAGLVLIFIAGLMIAKLGAKGMEMIWLDKPLTGIEPIASAIAYALGGIGPAAADVSGVYSAVQTRPPHCRSRQRIPRPHPQSGATGPDRFCR
jgi:hypothetical protein